MQFSSKKPHYEYLRKKWVSRHRNIHNNFWEKHGKAFKHFAIGSLSGLMLLSAPTIQELPMPHPTLSKDDILKSYNQNTLLVQILSDKIPQEVRPLETEEEEGISEALTSGFGFTVTPVIDDIRLNRNYGLIGGEQHLYRYPTDTLYAHADTTIDYAKFGQAGIAPHLGAWGYFAPSKQNFTEVDKLRERYYLAIQTFLAPGFAENVQKYRDFFKYRKMLVVNPKTGQAVVAVVADAGPADWTGKHLGGSPEVMDVLGLATGPRKGAVLYFFVDDPKNEVSLGPVQIINKL